MSPPTSSRAQARQRRSLIISLVVVVSVAFGSLLAVIAAGWTPKLGLDLAGGVSVVFKPATHASQSDLNETVTILTNRVDALGVSGAEVRTQGGDISVSVPGVKNAREVLNAIGQTAQMLFRPVLCYAPPYSAPKTQAGKPPPSPGPVPTACPSSYQLVTANLSGSTSSGSGVFYNIGPWPGLKSYPSTPQAKDAKGDTVLLPGLANSGFTDRYLLGPAELTGRIVKSANAQLSATGSWVVNMNLTQAGSAGWDKMSQTYFHEIIGIELDGIVQSAPITLPNSATWNSFDGAVQISGNFTEAQAQNLSIALNYGALPVRLIPLTAETVSPTLGKSSLQAGLAAGLAGLLLVLIYTIVYYRLLGFVVISGLAVTGAFLYALISALGHTSLAPSFTLAGVVGIIVSIGITVDSYIVYFERLKDETRMGRTVRTSVDRGFKSAFRTVLAADLVSLAAAVVLFLITVGDVRGFAFFLGLSTLLDIIITYFFTRPLVILLGRNDRLTEARRLGISAGLAVPVGQEPIGRTPVGARS
ncbi:MAG TPA: protein translocase subunit SecD [Acidimicrobiales bacterium]|nr:protein translocase subunit SecD [Acidimicrobiales bacterium]